MRVKQLWAYVPIPAKLKLLVDRITLSRITIFYFTFSLIHCIIQVVFQVQAFSINASAAKFLGDIIKQGNATEAGFTVLGQDLRLCNYAPSAVDASSCQVIWNGTSSDNTTLNTGSQVIAALASDFVSPASSAASSSLSSIVAQSSPSLSLSTSPSAPSSTLASLSSVSSSVSASSSASESLQSSSTASASAHKSTVTVVVRPTVDLAPLQSTITKSSIVKTTQTLTVTSTPSHSAVSDKDGDDDGDDDEEEDEDEGNDNRQRKRDTPHVISAVVNTSGQSTVQVGGLHGLQGSATLSHNCLVALNWPVSAVDNTKREDIVFIGFSFWVLGMSIVAILNESPPHIVASFLTHVLATGWSAFQLVNTNTFHTSFTRLTTDGACGINLLPDYWTARARAEIPTLALNVLALIISAFLSWKLMKSFGWQTFKRIGASLTMSRAYRSVLIFSIVVQLSVFFIVVTAALWVDQIYNGDIAKLTHRADAFRAIAILILVLVIPWLSIGWISVRREHKISMAVFLFLSFLYLVGWSAMFIAPSFRWTFVEWLFFSLMATASVFLALVTFILGIYCRTNFGKGLSRHLNAEEPLPGDDFEPALPYNEKGGDEEKVDFPSYEAPVPTYSAAYGFGPSVPPPAYMSAPRKLGPRFFAKDAAPFDPQPTLSTQSLVRQTSGSSQHSVSSSISTDSTMSMKGKRWMIE